MEIHEQYNPILWIPCAAFFFAAVGQMFSALHTAKDGTVPEVRLMYAMKLNAVIAGVMMCIWLYGYYLMGVDWLPLLVGSLGLCSVILVEFLVRHLMLSPPQKY